MSGRLFTIALPVRNGGDYLKPCVASILGQTLGDFELVVLDSGSTDGSLEWLRGLTDPRIRVLPSERPLSIEENWGRVLTLPLKGEFLTFVGHDDLLDADFLETIYRLVNAQPDAGLFLTHFRLIGSSGEVLRPCRPMPARETAAEFLAARLADTRDSFGTGYVMRSALYRRVGGIPPLRRLLYADDALFLRAMADSHRATAPEECFAYRLHPASAAMTTASTDYLAALEAYWELLEGMGRDDSEIARTLARYGPAYLALFGRGCRGAVLEDRVLRGQAADPALDARLDRLLARGGLVRADLRNGPGGRRLALLERAEGTFLGRAAGRLLLTVKDTRKRWRERPPNRRFPGRSDMARV